MTVNYADIYDQIISKHESYNRAENSPGYRACVRHLDRFRLCAGPALDVGCGVGFGLEYLAREAPGLEVHGCDVSGVALERAAARVGALNVPAGRVRAIRDGKLPFDDRMFGLVMCFDVVEHIDRVDLPAFRDELSRVCRPGGWLVMSVSLRAANTMDHHGDNAHRTVAPLEWWFDLLDPDEAVVDRRRREAMFWKQMTASAPPKPANRASKPA
jgi:SAM-dependent methyltransferase